MKKNDFDNRLQNDLFPEMPISFGRKLTKAMEDEGVKVKKRPTATGVFTGAVSLVAAAAVLLIVLPYGRAEPRNERPHPSRRPGGGRCHHARRHRNARGHGSAFDLALGYPGVHPFYRL